MTIYVDYYPDWLGVPRKWEGGGHMIGNDLDELHAFAASLGLRREWFQSESNFAHYDLTRSKRAQALAQGAVSIEPGHIPRDVLMRRADGSYLRRSTVLKLRRLRAKRS